MPACPLPFLLPPQHSSCQQHGPSEDLQIPALPLKSEVGVRMGCPLLTVLPPSFFTRLPTSGWGEALGHGQRRDTWVLTHLLPTAWHFGGTSSLLLQHTCPHQSYLGHGSGDGSWLGVLLGVRMEWSLHRFVCLSLPWWSRGCKESSFIAHSSCPLSKIPLDCSGMTCPLPLSLSLPASPLPPIRT